ncbi:head-tail adaptor protein [Shimia thalassica]|uniref:head-tail adaptor protein n=1 Tax=Shimia thalassica TaxID=1715693 RepID=UPI001C09DD43|nr:head-tail adaptor protein [Shimia thalassica]MBU2941410.1 head-tail adaptor protein [Shimia thalassica]MDO6505006.1 head-tail adaptor protein [Shimia thalassica]MDO6523263.1 head-tail adaptor protein [Shimia thalassica]
MKAGEFSDRAVFERRPSEAAGDDVAIDAYGNPTGDWVEVVSALANLRETPGREALMAGRPESKRTGTLRVHSWSKTRSITAGDRVLVRGATWGILSGPVQIDQRGRFLEFTIETGGAV